MPFYVNTAHFPAFPFKFDLHSPVQKPTIQQNDRPFA